MEADAPPRRTTERGPLLGRVRSLFAVFVGLVLLVELVEWLDARTPLVPHRAVAAVSLVVAAVCVLTIHRRRAAGILPQLAALLAVVGAGWGMGRNGSVIALLLGLLQFRALYGTRRGVAVAVAALVTAYGVLTYLLSGLDGVVDLGLVVIALGAAAISLVPRLLGEALARHDRAVAWEAELTDAAAELLRATTVRAVDAGLERTLAALRCPETDGAGGLLAAVPPGAIPPDRDALQHAVAEERWTAPPDLVPVLRRLHTDAALARQRLLTDHRFRVLAENSRDGIYLLRLRPAPAYRYLNPAGAELLGVTADELIADPGLDRRLVHPDDHGRLADARARGDGVLRETVLVRVVRPDGGTAWVQVEEQLLADGDEVIVQGTLRDVTEQHAQQEALERALVREQSAAEELRRLDELKTTFLQAVSHELRTPLTTVLGASLTLRERQDELTPVQRSTLADAIHRQAARLERLLSDLLDVDRLSRGIVEPNRAPVRLTSLVRRTVAGLQPDRPVEVDGEEVELEVDGPKVERVVENLVRNALKHTPRDAGVRVTVLGREDGALLWVDDDGPGVPDELKERLFEPFTQGPSATAAASPGTGIGLALVARFTELHGGRAWVEDAPGGGARFVVWLPGQRCEPPPTEAPQPRPATQPASLGSEGARVGVGAGEEPG